MRACGVAFLLFATVTGVAIAAGPAGFAISSPAFTPGGPMPAQTALHGGDVSPDLRVTNTPGGTQSLVLIVDDPDAPAGLWTHWLLWNMRAGTATIAAGTPLPGSAQGRNSFGHVRYDGPAPPSGTHRYFFHLYALNSGLALAPGSARAALESAMKSHVIGSAEMFGTFAAKP